MSFEDDTLDFTIAFHGPFHVSTGGTALGLDRTVDRDRPLPSTSIKGLIRAEAKERLRMPDAFIAEIFGAPGGIVSAWWWSDAEVVMPANAVMESARIRVDEASETAMDGSLMFGESIWATSARFRVGLRRPLSEEDLGRHSAVLRVAAASVTSLGGQRRRGEGWVTITPDQEVTRQDCLTLLRLRTGGAA